MLRRWTVDRRLRVHAGHVVEREILALKKERRESRLPEGREHGHAACFT
jgi:hypothetical protein